MHPARRRSRDDRPAARPSAQLCEGAQDALPQCLDDFTRACLPGLLDAVCDATPDNPLCDVARRPAAAASAGSAAAVSAVGGNGGGGGCGGGLPGLPGLGGLGGLGGLLNRPAVGDARHPGRGPTMGQLMAAYDPALVSLLTPGMVLR